MTDSQMIIHFAEPHPGLVCCQKVWSHSSPVLEDLDVDLHPQECTAAQSYDK